MLDIICILFKIWLIDFLFVLKRVKILISLFLDFSVFFFKNWLWVEILLIEDLLMNDKDIFRDDLEVFMSNYSRGFEV